MNEPRILLFIPVYNCQHQIQRVLSQVDQDIAAFISRVIIVNNRSTDDTEKAIKNFIQSNNFPTDLILFRNIENYSLGGSHKIAFNHAIENDFDYVIVLHGDDQGNINDIIPFLKDNSFQNYDSYLGSRFEKDSKLIGYSKFRIFGNKVFNTLLSLLSSRRLTDLGSGLNIYKTEYLKSKFYTGFPNNLTFNVYMLLYGVFIKSRFDFFPLTWREDDQVSNAKLFSQTMEIASLVFRYKTNAKKLFVMDANEFSSMEYLSEPIFSYQQK